MTCIPLFTGTEPQNCCWVPRSRLQLLICGKHYHIVQSFSKFRTFSKFRIIHIEENLILLNYSAGEFKILLEKVHAFNDIMI